MNERYEYLLDRYFSRRITAAEKAELEQLNASDPVLAEDFEWHRKVAAATMNTQRASFKAALQNEEQRYRKSPDSGWPVWVKYSYAAAAVIAVALAAVFFWPAPSTAPVAFVPYPNEFASAATGDTSPLQQASDAYQAQQYADAARLFESLDGPNDAYRFYSGVALAGSGDWQKAIDALTPLTQNSGEYSAIAWYYIAWCEQQSGHADKARAAAQRYLDQPERRNEAVFRKNAKQLLEAK